MWFRQDLRLHDNEALTDAIQLCDDVIPVYVFDERLYEGSTSFGFPKIDRFRAQFIIESVEDLRRSLRSKGSDLIVRYGKPEEIIFEIASSLHTSWIFCNRERTQEEVQVQDTLEQKLWTVGQEMRYYRGKMLFYTADLPFPVPQTPDVFTHFRKEVEKIVPIRKPITSPDRIPLFSKVDPGKIPSLPDLGFDTCARDERAAFAFKGGENEGLERLKYYLWESDHISSYKKTRNGLLGEDYSSKFSPYLAQGCLSPKKIYYEISEYERKVKKNQSTYWLKFELMWRDFFRFMAKKHGNKIFLKGGIQSKVDPRWSNDMETFHKWASGSTGIPFIDANMTELNRTGFMSNRGRQNVASFLIKDLGINWLLGAEYFESLLIDYDPASNYGNWNYLAGVGSDPVENRYFNILSQAQRYDPEGAYVKHWLPQLLKLPKDKVHRAYDLDERELQYYDVQIDDYHRPVIEPDW